MAVGNALLLTVSRYSDYFDYHCQHTATIPKLLIPNQMGTILNIKTVNHKATILPSINVTTNGRDLVSYRYQLKACNYQCQIKGNNPQPVYQNREPHRLNLMIY